MAHLPPLLLLAVVGQRGEKDVREGGCLLGVILGGGDTILIFCIWEEKGERRKEEKGGEGRGGERRREERGERGGEGREEEKGERREENEEEKGERRREEERGGEGRQGVVT